MFDRSLTESSGLEDTLDRLLLDMKEFKPDSDEYANCVGHLDTIYKLKLEAKPKRLSRDTMAIVGGNFAAIALMLIFEKEHVVTSKALSLLLKIAR